MLENPGHPQAAVFSGFLFHFVDDISLESEGEW